MISGNMTWQRMVKNLSLVVHSFGSSQFLVEKPFSDFLKSFIKNHKDKFKVT
ncbi:hypothetical protein GCM10012290_25890 [Halolactibacillus alkaliphilus]|uniref:Uncharacterized protein n=1 Tax=Halolactibacillus alkaliphilus TaxID=442899 RepID=A0A511X524_9BACI|nr:hypothetical protein HAL01_25200 [Halolactibacillus alkaliphilus]GGN76295.1 hypothetical protein GCM10012290_25890 [Halolactibacillus alkaliphilus]